MKHLISDSIKKTRLFFCSIIFVLSSFFVIASPIAQKELINSLQEKRYDCIQNQLFLVIIIALLQITFLIITSYYISYEEERISYSLRKNIVFRLYGKKSEILHTLENNYLNDRIKEDCITISAYIRKIIEVSFSKIIIFIFSNIYIGLYMPKLLLIIYTIAIIVLFVYFVNNKKIQEKANVLKENQNKCFSSYSETVNNIDTIKVHSWQKYEIEKINKITQMYLSIYKKFLKITTIVLSFASSVQVFFTLLIIIAGTFLVKNNNIKIGDLISLISFSAYIISPITSFLELIGNYFETKTSYNRIKELLSFEEQNDGSVCIEKINKISVKIDNYSYNDNIINKNVQLEFQKGKVYCICGDNGVGKTTFLKILLKLHENYNGEIIINDCYNIQEICNDSFYRNISYIEQIPHLFNTTVERNIFYGDTHIKDMPDFLKNFAESLHKLNDGFETEIVNNTTSTISGGEKQKISILRELNKSSDLVLMDEPSTYLDQESIDSFYNLLNIIKYDKIIIIVSHDESIKKHADQIITL